MKHKLFFIIMTCLCLILLSSCQSHSCEAGEWEIEKSATCSIEGLQTKKCIHCNKILESKSLPIDIIPLE